MPSKKREVAKYNVSVKMFGFFEHKVGASEREIWTASFYFNKTMYRSGAIKIINKTTYETEKR